jgi:hypothetical protein
MEGGQDVLRLLGAELVHSTDSKTRQDTSTYAFRASRVLLAPNYFGARTAGFTLRLNSARLWLPTVAFFTPRSFCLQRAFSVLQPQVVLEKINLLYLVFQSCRYRCIAIAIACCSTASLCL